MCIWKSPPVPPDFGWLRARLFCTIRNTKRLANWRVIEELCDCLRVELWTLQWVECESNCTNTASAEWRILLAKYAVCRAASSHTHIHSHTRIVFHIYVCVCLHFTECVFVWVLVWVMWCWRCTYNTHVAALCSYVTRACICVFLRSTYVHIHTCISYGLCLIYV